MNITTGAFKETKNRKDAAIRPIGFKSLPPEDTKCERI